MEETDEIYGMFQRQSSYWLRRNSEDVWHLKKYNHLIHLLYIFLYMFLI